MTQLQDFRRGLEQVARGAEVDGARLRLSRAQLVSQPFQRVLVQNDPALAWVVAIAADVAVDAIVEAAGGEVNRRKHREAGQTGWRQHR